MASLTEKKIANFLNEHFSDTGARMQADITSDASLNDFHYQCAPPLFELSDISMADVATAIDRLKSTQSCGLDGVTANLVKSAKTELLEPLTYLFNLSIKQRCFPDCWKIATVKPLFKAGDSSDANNYRPISVLPTFGKLLERIIYNQCNSYLSVNNLLSEAQSGFREGRSTATCLTSFLNDIIEGADGGGWLWSPLPGPHQGLRYGRVSNSRTQITISWFQIICNQLVQIVLM